MPSKSNQFTKSNSKSIQETSQMEKLAKSIADLYKVNQITNTKVARCPDCLNDEGILHENVSSMAGHKTIQQILINGYAHYNKVESSASKSDEKEIKAIKEILPIISIEVDKLQKLSNKDPDNEQLLTDYKVKKATLDEYREKYGKLLTSKKDISDVNSTKISDIKKAYKILIGYYNHNKKAKAVQLYNLIKGYVMPTSKNEYYHDDDDEYDDLPDDFFVDRPKEENVEASAPTNDGWTSVPVKKNPFDSFNKKKTANYAPVSQPVSETPAISKQKLDELMMKYEAKQYITPAHRKIVEEEIAKKKAKEEADKKAFPQLGGGNISVQEKKFTGVSFKDKLSTEVAKLPPVVEEPVHITNTKYGMRVVDMGPSYGPQLVETIVNGYMTTYVYKEIDEEGNDVFWETTLPNNHFRAKMKEHIEEEKIHKQYLWDINHKPWCKGMTFDEWCDFKDEVYEMEELERQREEEKYGAYGYDDDYQYGDHDEDDGEYYDDVEESYNPKFNKEYTVESY